MPEASILIVAGSEDRLQQRLLEALEGQTRRGFEIVFIDDMSVDRAYEIVEGYARRASVPVKLSREHGTLGRLYNKALDMAEG